MSADSVLDGQDLQLDRLTTWTGGDILFDGFASPLSETVTHFIVSFDFSSAANSLHLFNLTVTAPTSINCGTDPVLAARWPLGAPDVPLPVEITTFVTEQDATFGALRLRWIAQSERDNAGFIVLRRGENDTLFTPAASYTSVPELVGRGTDLTAASTFIWIADSNPAAATFIAWPRKPSTSSTRSTTWRPRESRVFRRPISFLGEAYPNPFNQAITIPSPFPSRRGWIS